MSSFRPDRRFFIAALLAVTGCGFTPALGPNGPARDLMGAFEFKDATTRNAFDFVTQLEQRLGVAEQPRYQLSYTITTSEDRIGLTPKQEIIRLQVVGNAGFTVRDATTGKILTSGNVDNFTSYSVGVLDLSASPPRTSSTISTLAAKRDASTRLMVTLADQVVTRLIATSDTWAK